MTQEELKKQEESSNAFKAIVSPLVEKIIKKLDLNATIQKDTHVSHQINTEPCSVHGATVKIEICRYARMSGGMSDKINVEVTIALPEDGIMANTYLDHVAKAESINKDHYGFYCSGPKYTSYEAERNGHNIEAYSPWNNHYIRIYARDYTVSMLEQAVNDLLLLARPIVKHLSDLKGLRFWHPEDVEVVARANEIVKNADFHETDCDREERAHWLKDSNSFFKGWFFPFNDKGKGSFDTHWPSSVDYAASNMGHKGSFEYSVACVLLQNPEYIEKARKACVIRKETVRY